jgi:hypothetical protein
VKSTKSKQCRENAAVAAIFLIALGMCLVAVISASAHPAFWQVLMVFFLINALWLYVCAATVENLLISLNADTSSVARFDRQLLCPWARRLTLWGHCNAVMLLTPFAVKLLDIDFDVLAAALMSVTSAVDLGVIRRI